MFPRNATPGQYNFQIKNGDLLSNRASGTVQTPVLTISAGTTFYVGDPFTVNGDNFLARTKFKVDFVSGPSIFEFAQVESTNENKIAVTKTMPVLENGRYTVQVDFDGAILSNPGYNPVPASAEITIRKKPTFTSNPALGTPGQLFTVNGANLFFSNTYKVLLGTEILTPLLQSGSFASNSDVAVTNGVLNAQFKIPNMLPGILIVCVFDSLTYQDRMCSRSTGILIHRFLRSRSRCRL